MLLDATRGLNGRPSEPLRRRCCGSVLFSESYADGPLASEARDAALPSEVRRGWAALSRAPPAKLGVASAPLAACSV